MASARNKKFTDKNIIVIAIVALVVVVALYAFFIGRLYTIYSLSEQIGNDNTPQITNFKECAASGQPIRETYPEQCVTPDGRVFVNQTKTQPQDDLKNSNPSTR